MKASWISEIVRPPSVSSDRHGGLMAQAFRFPSPIAIHHIPASSHVVIFRSTAHTKQTEGNQKCGEDPANPREGLDGFQDATLLEKSSAPLEMVPVPLQRLKWVNDDYKVWLEY